MSGFSVFGFLSGSTGFLSSDGSAFTDTATSADCPPYVTVTFFVSAVSFVLRLGLKEKSFAVSGPYATTFVVPSDIVTVRLIPVGSNVSPALYSVLAGFALISTFSTVGFSGSTGVSAFTSIPISAVLPAYVTSTLFIPSVSAVSSVGLNTKSFAVSSPYATSFVVLSDIVTVRTSPLGSNVSPAL